MFNQISKRFHTIKQKLDILISKFLVKIADKSVTSILLQCMLRVIHIRNKKRSNKHGILQTWSIVSVPMLLNQQESIVMSPEI